MESFGGSKILDLTSLGIQKNSGELPWIHFLAIGGTGMGALAGLFKNAGVKVTGSDGPLYPPMSTFLEAQKIPLKTSFAPENLSGSSWGMDQKYPDLVIVGNAISRTNLEAQEMEKLVVKGLLRKMSFPEAIGNFVIAKRDSFVVAGTHGKTTTTSLLAWAFEVLGKDPGFFIGGIPKNFECGSRWGSSVFVSEGDEYDTAYWDKESKFLHYRPTWVVGTGIEFDHADIFSTVEQIENSFLKLSQMTSQGWLLVDQLSAPRPTSVEKIAVSLKAQNKKVFRYGEDPESDYCLLNWERASLPWNEKEYGLKFDIRAQGEKATFFSPMLGRHNLLNALGNLGVLHASGNLKKLSDFQEVLRTFRGVARRQDVLFDSDTFVVVDDFAHHPTAIKETIAAIREKYPSFEVAAFFEPRSATSARNTLYGDFVKSFKQAHSVFIQEATKLNVPENERLKVQDLVRELIGKGDTSHAIARKTVEELMDEFLLWKKSKEKVVALVMSNGAFGGLTKNLAQLR
jgi:UDP-N-acetylmuramate: L-alanyl-gamma-D-glutamyl-meso-diaminopimelate ligase